MKRLVIATNNEHKLREIETLLRPLGIECLSLKDIGFTEEIDENGLTFFDNAQKKAEIVAKHSGLVSLGDDSGLVVDSLPEELGVKSKRFSSSGVTSDNNLLLLKKLEGKTNRQAHFISQIVLVLPNGLYYAYEGRVDGEIAFDSKGTNGFGYDPLFIIAGDGRRMAELCESEKNEISHRGRAIMKLIEDIKNETIDFQ